MACPVASAARPIRRCSRFCGLAEGGPTLNGQLAAADLLDEVCLTLSPLLVGSDAKRILSGPGLPGGQQWRLSSLCEQDGLLFLRYRRQ
jgi:riboflavin biosynthesis pyrimidine reductase